MDATDEAMMMMDGTAAETTAHPLLEYLLALLPLVLGASQPDLRRSLSKVHARASANGNTDDNSDPHALLARFADDSAVQSIYINKVRLVRSRQAALAAVTEDAAIATPATASTTFRYTITPNIAWHPDNVASLVLIKRALVIDPARPIAEQVHFVNLFGPALAAATAPPSTVDGTLALPTNATDGLSDNTARTSANPYESLHSIVHLAVQPYFEAYISRKSPAQLAQEEAAALAAEEADIKGISAASVAPPSTALVSSKQTEADLSSNTGIPIAKRKFAELELSLLHLQQNVEIPEIVLGVHPVIARTVERARQLGVRPVPDLVDPPSALSDSTFLNKVQAEVNAWIKEIQNVTKLSRDVASGTASQEVNFWLSMEKALEGIEEQLRSDPISLTLDVLKHAKRFHATVSFIADTGLKEATDVVHKYNLLMKDFPLNELLSATDLDRIQDGLVAVFSHLNKKLKLSPYPIRRALPLVEAISKDLSDQLLRVLNAQKLMYASFPTFEAALSLAAAIFTTWDDLLKEFTNVAREVTRKRSEKFLPIKINAHHIASGLKARIEYLRNFRKHHQQLVGMVSPTKGVVGAGKDSTDAGLSLLGGLDMQEEVRLAWDEVKNVDVLDTSEGGTQIWVTAETA